MSIKSSLPQWFERAVAALQAGDVDGYLRTYAPDAVHEFPFAPEGAPRSLVGYDAIAAYMRQLPKMIRFGSLGDIRAREVGDEVIIEATGHHRRIKDDVRRDLDYVWFITLRDDKVVRIRDYMNPLQLSDL